MAALRHGFVKINVDGSCSNSDMIGTGGLVRDELGLWLGSFASKDGYGDVLMSKLFAIYHGFSMLVNLWMVRAT